MIVGYGKLCRSWSLPPGGGTVGNGDIEVQYILHRLATRHPDVEWRLVSRNSGENPQAVGYPSNVTNPWAKGGPMMNAIRAREKGRTAPLPPDEIGPMCDDLTMLSHRAFYGCDEMVLWLGHHGTSNSPLPPKRAAQGLLTRPYDNFILYGSYMIRNLNWWKDVNCDHEEIWLCADPRNYLKARDVKWPLRQPVIAQRDQFNETRHYRYGDTNTPKFYGYQNLAKEEGINWVSTVEYRYDGRLELGTVRQPSEVKLNTDWANRFDFGVMLNENRKDVKNSRLTVLQEYVLPFWPECEIFGKWADDSKAKLGRPDIRLCPYEYADTVTQRWRCTMTTPASGSAWATAKPWECFAAGTVCFFHPRYDDQDHILDGAPKELHDWLRVESPEQLRKRVEHLGQNEAAWQWIIAAQRAHYEASFEATHGGIVAIERRLGLL